MDKIPPNINKAIVKTKPFFMPGVLINLNQFCVYEDTQLLRRKDPNVKYPCSVCYHIHIAQQTSVQSQQ